MVRKQEKIDLKMEKSFAEMKIYTEKSADAVYEKVALQIVGDIFSKRGKVYNLAISGGESAKKIFGKLLLPFAAGVDWQNVNFFWVDERCVPPESAESNFGNAENYFFKEAKIAGARVFRIKGEKSPEAEAEDYSNLVFENVPENSLGVPSFDCIVLGMGADGHTASIFPNEKNLINSSKIYEVSVSPVNGTRRVGMTPKLILAAGKIILAFTGKEKAGAFFAALESAYIGGRYSLPISKIFAAAKNIEIFTDVKRDEFPLAKRG